LNTARNSTVGSIDPTYFRDLNGQRYVIWKEDGNGRNPPEKYTPIWAAPLSPDGLQVIGAKIFLLQNDPNSWETILVEAPWVIYVNETFFLFYSGSLYNTAKYAVGVARSKSLLGPYVKFSSNPIVHTNPHWSGPGHCAVLETASKNPQYFMLYHSWVGNQIGGNYPRVTMMDAILWDDLGWPYIKTFSPSFGPTPLPQ